MTDAGIFILSAKEILKQDGQSPEWQQEAEEIARVNDSKPCFIKELF